MIQIGIKLRSLRRQRNLMQKDVAKALCITQQTYSRYENGTNEPDFEMLKRICKYFNVSIDSMIDNDLDVLQSINVIRSALDLIEQNYITNSNSNNNNNKKITIGDKNNINNSFNN